MATDNREDIVWNPLHMPRHRRLRLTHSHLILETFSGKVLVTAEVDAISVSSWSYKPKSSGNAAGGLLGMAITSYRNDSWGVRLRGLSPQGRPKDIILGWFAGQEVLARLRERGCAVPWLALIGPMETAKDCYLLFSASGVIGSAVTADVVLPRQRAFPEHARWQIVAQTPKAVVELTKLGEGKLEPSLPGMEVRKVSQETVRRTRSKSVNVEIGDTLIVAEGDEFHMKSNIVGELRYRFGSLT